MIKTLTKHGNSYALIFDKPILELLQITVDTPLELSTNGDQIFLTPVRGKQRDERLQAAIEKVNAKFGDALKRLAD